MGKRRESSVSDETSSDSSVNETDGEFYCASDCSTRSEFESVVNSERAEVNAEYHALVDSQEETLTDKLMEWAIHNQITLVTTKELLQILKRSFPDLPPTDPKTLMKREKRAPVEKNG